MANFPVVFKGFPKCSPTIALKIVVCSLPISKINNTDSFIVVHNYAGHIVFISPDAAKIVSKHEG